MHHFLDIDFDPKLSLISIEEAEHARKVLRLKDGEHISLSDGKGNFYIGKLNFGQKGLQLEITESRFESANQNPIILAIAPPKNPARLEWLIEKATEIGIDQIYPILTMRTERPKLKLDRAIRIIHAASKQCMRAYIPKIEKLTHFEDVLKLPVHEKFIAHCEVDFDKKDLISVISSAAQGARMILIGPEGDFHPVEIEKALKAGCKPVSLGKNRLRTETAALLAASIMTAFG